MIAVLERVRAYGIRRGIGVRIIADLIRRKAYILCLLCSVVKNNTLVLSRIDRVGVDVVVVLVTASVDFSVGFSVTGSVGFSVGLSVAGSVGFSVGFSVGGSVGFRLSGPRAVLWRRGLIQSSRY